MFAHIKTPCFRRFYKLWRVLMVAFHPIDYSGNCDAARNVAVNPSFFMIPIVGAVFLSCLMSGGSMAFDVVGISLMLAIFLFHSEYEQKHDCSA